VRQKQDIRSGLVTLETDHKKPQAGPWISNKAIRVSWQACHCCLDLGTRFSSLNVAMAHDSKHSTWINGPDSAVPAVSLSVNMVFHLQSPKVNGREMKDE
jgi:hypothetical protein